jgi:hypothetical protein
MAFENFPASSGTTPAPPEPPKTDWRFFITIGLVILLLGTWGYIIWDKSKVKETIQKQDVQYAGVVAERDTLSKMLEEASIRYDDLKISASISASKKDSIITAKDRVIAEKQSKIKSLLSKANATKEELAEAKSLIASLNTDIDTYKQQIEVLKGENAQLTKEKEVVTEERNALRRKADSANSVILEKDKLLDVGSTLNASNFNIIGINLKGNGRESETSRARRVDKLRISFSLDENRITSSGTKNLYICIADPDGKPILDNAIGSGTLETREDGTRSYTQQVAVNYVQGQRQVVSFDWNQSGEYKKGTYKITVYQNGFKIGEGITSFRK